MKENAEKTNKEIIPDNELHEVTGGVDTLYNCASIKDTLEHLKCLEDLKKKKK